MDTKLKSVTLRDKHRLRVLKNRELRKLFVPKKEIVIGNQENDMGGECSTHWKEAKRIQSSDGQT